MLHKEGSIVELLQSSNGVMAKWDRTAYSPIQRQGSTHSQRGVLCTLASHSRDECKFLVSKMRVLVTLQLSCIP